MVSITGCFLVFLLLHYRRRRESFPQTVCKTKAPSTGAFCLLGNFHSAAAEPKKRVGQNGVGDPRCTLITTIVRRELSRSTSSRSDCAVSINHTLIQYVRRSRLMVESAGCRLGPYPPVPPSPTAAAPSVPPHSSRMLFRPEPIQLRPFFWQTCEFYRSARIAA